MARTSHGVDVETPVVTPPQTIDALTGIRALAAGWVLLFHLTLILPSLLPGASALDPWFRTGAMGVDVFFVLSGFVLSHNYAARFRRQGRWECRTFVIARFARLYPVHLLTLLGSAVLVGVLSVDAALPTENESHTAAQLLANLLLLHALPGAVAWNAPAWSVGCEAVAYLVFPLFAASLLRLRPATAIALCVTVSLAQFTLVVHLGRMPSSLPPLSWVRIAGEFALGCLLWAAWRHHPEPRRWWDVVAVLSLTATVVWLGFAPLGPPTFAVVPLLALVVVAAASAAGPVRAMLASRWMVWGGRVSYSLYLTHYLVMVVLGRLVPVRELTDSPLWLRLGVVALHLAAVIGVAATTYHLVEEPLRAWLRQRLASPQTTRVTRSAP